MERKGFIRSFIKRIDLNHPTAEIEYSVPLVPPKGKEPLRREVLSIVQSGCLVWSTSLNTYVFSFVEPFVVATKPRTQVPGRSRTASSGLEPELTDPPPHCMADPPPPRFLADWRKSLSCYHYTMRQIQITYFLGKSPHPDPGKSSCEGRYPQRRL